MGSAWKWKWWIFASMKGEIPNCLKGYSDKFARWERVWYWNFWVLTYTNKKMLQF